MAVDYILHLECDAKRELGSGDPVQGSLAMLEMLKARFCAEIGREQAEEEGLDPDKLSITLHDVDPDGEEHEKEVTIRELEEEAAPLQAHEAKCAGCPANFVDSPFGCVSVLHYPIAPEQEEWLMERLQPIDTLGGRLFADFIREFDVTGEIVDEMREGGFLDAEEPVVRPLGEGDGKVECTSNQLLETLLHVGNTLDPGHCLGLLLWLGCIRVDGEKVSDPDSEAARALLTLDSPEAREERTSFDSGPAESDPILQEVQTLLHAVYLSWVKDWPVLIWA
jgi:hypothetical protein